MKPPKQRRVSRGQNGVVDSTVEVELQEFIVEQRRLLIHKRPERVTEDFQQLLALLEDPNMAHVNDRELLKQIHGMVTLTLAYAVSFRDNRPDYVPCLQLLCRCLSELYQATLQDGLFTSEECSESFCLLLQITIRLHNQSNSEPNGCIDILQVLAVWASLDLPDSLQKQGLLHLVQLYQENTRNATKEQPKLLLQTLAHQQSPKTSDLAQTALAAIDALNKNKVKTVDNIQPNLFYIQCLLLGSKNVNDECVFGDTVITQLLEETLDGKQDESQAMEAAHCLCCMAQNRASSRSLQQALLRVLVETDKDKIRVCVIPGLCSNHGPEIWTNIVSFVDPEQLQRITSALFDVIAHSKGDKKKGQTHCIKEATSMLLEVLDLIESYHLRLEAVSRGDLVRICAALLQHENCDIVCQTITLLSRWIRKDGVLIIERYPEILSALADTVDSSFSSLTMKHTILEVLSEILRQHGSLTTIMVRQPKVLDALVGMAASEVESESKQLALSILTTLSKNVGNRRIMAKQLGLIACLIRYVRGLENNSEIGTTLRREAVKENILQLATAL